MGCYKLTYQTNLKVYNPTSEVLPSKILTSQKSVSNACSVYFYGYQSSERDDEVKGKGNSYTTFFRLLDPRVGRWLSIDPESNSLPWQSPYCSMDNNPIIFYDPLGDKVKNKDRITADQKKNEMNSFTNQLNNIMTDKNITPGMKRRDFREQGGSKSDWKTYKGLKKDLKTATAEFVSADYRANKTQKVIDDWKKSSPVLFNEVDSHPVDFMLTT